MKGSFHIFIAVVLVCVLFLSLAVFSMASTSASVTDATFSSVIMNVGADESQRNITWYSNYQTTGEVRYAKAPTDNGDFPAEYSVAPAIVVKTTTPGYYSYKATMINLEANTSYVYRLVVGSTVSDTYRFDVKEQGDDFSFAFITDPQASSESDAQSWNGTLNTITDNFGGVSFIVSAGDQTSDASDEEHFDYFIDGKLSSLAISTTLGPPHDNSALYSEHYNLPNLSSTYGISSSTSDYFYTYNNVLFMHLNVEKTDYDSHKAFLRNAIVDNPDCIWRIVVLHYSFFTGGDHSADSAVTEFRSNLAGEFNALGIDLVLSGHDHLYSRSKLMIDGTTVSGDVITNNSVTDPSGTLYLCGTTSTGASYYDVEQHDDDAYIAYRNDADRKGIVIFDVTEESLTLKAYFVDGSAPQQFDTFTINKSVSPVRLNKDTDMLEITTDGGNTRIPLVNAYAYASALVRVYNGYWSLSTDGGTSYTSLGITSSDNSYVLRINTATGYWELSSDNGASFTSLSIAVNKYAVKYVADIDSSYGDATNLSLYEWRNYTATTPDAPKIKFHGGSIAEGKLYDWSWEYYLVGGDGTPVTAFEYGGEYLAYLVCEEIPVSNILYISNTEDPENYTYTWANAWKLVKRCTGETMTLVLKEAITLTSTDAVSFNVPVNVTIDLNGKTLKTSELSPAVKFTVGSSGSVMNVITSAEGGKINANTSTIFQLQSNTGSEITINFGSAVSKPVSVTCGYLTTGTTNFKYKSILNLNFLGGTYTVNSGIISVNNVNSTTKNYNIYKITANDADFKFKGAASCIVRTNSERLAHANSFIKADNCTFTDTYKSDNSSSRYLIREDIWLGTAEFTNCDFVGMSIGHANGGAALTKGTYIIGSGCTFTNSDTTFNVEKDGFCSSNVQLEDGCVIVNEGDVISIVNLVRDRACAVEIGGVITTYEAGTDFATVLKNIDVAANSGKEVNVTLNTSFTLSTTIALSKATNLKLNIDLAGNTLTLASGGKVELSGSGFDVNVYSSVAGGKLIYSNSDDCIQLNTSGAFTLGSEEYKNTLTVNSGKYILNMGMLVNGTVVNVNLNYCQLNLGSFGVLRLNAKGADNVTLVANITGCTLKGSTGMIWYNSSTSLSATKNGGVYNTDSAINLKDSSFTCTASAPANFFGTNNFSDRYFGKVNIEGCAFDNYIFNGARIIADESLEYNTYYDTLIANNPTYDPYKTITVGKGCTFKNFGTTFNDDVTAFTAPNVSFAEDCGIGYTDGVASVHCYTALNSDSDSHWLECSCGAVKADLLESHLGGEATCNEQAECSVCGVKYGALSTTHTPEADDGDCTTAVRCSVCQAVTTEANATHVGGTADCQNRAECTLCGKEYGEFDDNSHNPSNALSYDQYHHWNECTRCGARLNVAEHTYTGEFDPDCDCGYAGGHQHLYSRVNSDELYHWNECSCGLIDESNVAKHAYDNGCDTTCDCGYERAITHAFTVNKSDETYHYTECSVCGEVDEATRTQHFGGVATCTSKAVCSVCSGEYGALDANNHDTNGVNEWLKDSIAHWQICNCQEVVNRTQHTSSVWLFGTNAHYKVCEVCQRSFDDGLCQGGTATCQERALCNVCNNSYGTLAEHEYSDWQSDDSGHWRECECGERADEAEHAFGDVADAKQSCKCGYSVDVPEDEAPTGFFARLFAAIAAWFKGIGDWFKNLFG